MQDSSDLLMLMISGGIGLALVLGWVIKWDYKHRNAAATRDLQLWADGRDTLADEAVGAEGATGLMFGAVGIFTDAERYSWLRRQPLDAVQQGGLFVGQTPDNVVINGADLDARVDRAIWLELTGGVR